MRSSLLAALPLIVPFFAASCSSPNEPSLAGLPPSANGLVALSATSTSVYLTVHLPMARRDEAEREIGAITDPLSPQFGHYLSADEFRTKFAPSAATLASVRAWLALGDRRWRHYSWPRRAPSSRFRIWLGNGFQPA